MRSRRHKPMVDGWVCPRCGANGIRHGRGGARACKTNNTSPHCRGLECECEDGRCYGKRPDGFGWRRSPCKTARCYHCGWEGEVRSREFERAFGNSRCPNSSTGWHYPVIQVQPNTEPSSLVLRFRCTLCGWEASTVLDPIDDIRWFPPEAGSEAHEVDHDHDE